MIVDSAIYVDGRRAAASGSPGEAYEACRERGRALDRPLQTARGGVRLGRWRVRVALFSGRDVTKAHQRPKTRCYGETLFGVLKAARYVDETETVEFRKVHVFLGLDFGVTVRHGEAPVLGEVRERLEGEPELLRRGPAAVLYAIMDRMVVEGLENDVDKIEAELFGDNPGISRRKLIYAQEVYV